MLAITLLVNAIAVTLRLNCWLLVIGCYAEGANMAEAVGHYVIHSGWPLAIGRCLRWRRLVYCWLRRYIGEFAIISCRCYASLIYFHASLNTDAE